MMRSLALTSLLLLAACSDSAEADQKSKAAADKANLKLAAGQWETTTEITKVDSQDNGAPVLKAAQKTVVSTCVGEAEGRKPAAAVLGGMEDCRYENVYMSRGRVTAGLSCTRPGLDGRILVSSEGQYGADSFETNASLQTYLVSDGDAKAAAKISGRRIGPCAPAKAS